MDKGWDPGHLGDRAKKPTGMNVVREDEGKVGTGAHGFSAALPSAATAAG